MADSFERPHIVFITTDQQRGDCTGIDGHPILETPHLDQLANEGVYFSKAYSPCPVCVPALDGGDPVGDRIFHGEIGAAPRRHHCPTDGRYKYMWFRLGGREYLFDLEVDPNEVNNLAGDEARVAEWRNRLIDLLHARGDSAVKDGALAPTPYRPTPEAQLRAMDPFGRRPH